MRRRAGTQLAAAAARWAACPYRSGPRWSSGGCAEGAASASWERSRPSYWHQPGSEPLSSLTIGQLVEQAARRWRDREALVSVYQRRRLTFGQALDQIDRLAAGFLEIGLLPKDRIGIWSPNSVEWYVTSLAASRAGLVLVPINPAFQAPELQYCIQKVGIKALIVAERFKSQNYYKLVKSIAPELPTSSPGSLQSENVPTLTSLIVVGETSLPGAYRFSELVDAASSSTIQKIAELQISIQCDDPANIQFTSGTTGKPKAAVLSHHNIVNNSYIIGKRFQFSTSGIHRICLPVPLFHCYGFCNGLMAALHHGATLILPSGGFNAAETLAALRQEVCTAVYGTPTMLVDLVNSAKSNKEDTPSSLTMALSSGSPCSPDLFQQMHQTFQLKRVCSVYGLTETSPVVFQSQPNDTQEQMTETIGHISEHVEAKVVDSNGKMVPLGSPGELWIRGYCVMLGYWGDDDKTKELIGPGGWLKTGDQFVLRSDGYGQVVGRIKDMIIRGGENIYPREIEDFLESHSDILEAQVFGIPDTRLGEVVCACLRIRENQNLTEDDIKNFCKGQISHFKIPSIIKFVDDFPKTGSGKIQKFKLKDIILQELAQQKEE